MITERILGGALAASLVACGIMSWRANHWHGEYVEAQDSYVREQERHAITLQSVETLKATVKGLNDAANERAEALERAKAKAAKAASQHDREMRATDSKIARLTEIARTAQSCAAPDELLRELEGL